MLDGSSALKKLLMAAAVTGLVGLPAVAQFGHFPSNTPTTGGGNSWPMNFGSTTGRFVQFLDATNSDLPTGTPLKITEVAFAPTGTTPFVCSSDFQMRMSHLNTTSTFTTVPDNVYANDLGPCPTNLINRTAGFNWGGTASAWNDFGTDCDFGWDGQSIILLEIRYRGQNTAQGVSCHSDTSIPRAWSNATTADNYVATTATLTSGSAGLKTRLGYVKDHICLVPETTQIGNSSAVSLVGFNPGESFKIAASLGQSPFSVGNCNICLTVDNIFLASLQPLPFFGGYNGIADGSGNGAGKFAPPAITALVGTCVYHAAVGVSTAGINCTNTAGTMLVP